MSTAMIIRPDDAPPAPHNFVGDADDYGYRPRCITCGQERATHPYQPHRIPRPRRPE